MAGALCETCMSSKMRRSLCFNHSLGVCITVSADIAASDNIKTIHIIFSTYLDLTFRNHSIIAYTILWELPFFSIDAE